MGRKSKRSKPRNGAKSGPDRSDVDALIGLYRQQRFGEALRGAEHFVKKWPALGFGWNMKAASAHALGSLEEAAASYRRAVGIEPDNAEAYNNLGNVLRELKQYAESAQAHERAIEIRPGFLEAEFNLGLTLLAAGELPKAEAALKRVLTARPDIADAHNHLGNLYKAQDRIDEAVDSYRQALRIAPGSAEYHGNLGSALAAGGFAEEAETAFRRALEIQPESPGILSNLGLFMLSERRFEEAGEFFRKALDRQPQSADLHNNLGIALRGAGRLQAAAGAFERAISLKPDFVPAYHHLGDALMDLGRLDKAEALHRQAVERQPDSASARRNLGVALAVLGRPSEALAAYRRALELDPGRAELYYRISEVKTFESGDPDVDRIEALLVRDDVALAERVFLHYAAGKALADTGTDYDRSFQHYAAGARARRAQFDYDVAADEAAFERIARVCTPALIDAVSRCGYAGDGAVPVLIVGMPRSGTTLVESILAGHAEVHGAGERFDLERLVSRMDRERGCEYPAWLGRLGGDDWQDLGKRYLDSLAETAPRAKLITDKMPNNFRYLAAAVGMLKDVRIIHVQRQPLDTCISCFTHLFEGEQLFSYDLEELGRFYNAYSRLMDHWRGILPRETFLEVTYEALVDDSEAWARAMCAFCGLDWDPGMLDFHAKERAVPTASLAQVRQPIYRKAMGRWNAYAGHLGPLINVLEDHAAGDAHAAPQASS